MGRVSQPTLLRLAAALLDGLVVSVVLMPPASVISYAAVWFIGATKWVNIVWYVALFVVILAMLLRDGRRGRSLGKRILGLRLRTPDDEPCSYGRSIVRNLPLVIPGWNVLEVILVLAGRNRTGDRMARTSVTEE